MPVKQIGHRFFLKFMDLIDKRAGILDPSAQLSLDVNPEDDGPEPKLRSMRQFDQRSYDARMQVLKSLPANSVGAEIGKYMGAFAQLILDNVKPKKLYLIDPWAASATVVQSGSWYETVDQQYMDAICEMVNRRFSADVADGTVQILRDYSSNAFRSMDDVSLDWVYLDGDHSYETVRKDLQLSFAKVRGGGFIAGDDCRVVDGWWKDNVVRAVTEFVDVYPVELVLERAGQFLLRKS